MNSSADAILTYDLGTTRIKVALFDLRGRLVAQRASRHLEQLHEDRAWQDADAWWSDAVRLTHALLTAKPRRVIAISVCGRLARRCSSAATVRSSASRGRIAAMPQNSPR